MIVKLTSCQITTLVTGPLVGNSKFRFYSILAVQCPGPFSCLQTSPLPSTSPIPRSRFLIFITLTCASNPVARNSFAPELAEAVVLGIVATFKDKNTA
jgi:hypothetical protein